MTTLKITFDPFIHAFTRDGVKCEGSNSIRSVFPLPCLDSEQENRTL